MNQKKELKISVLQFNLVEKNKGFITRELESFIRVLEKLHKIPSTRLGNTRYNNQELKRLLILTYLRASKINLGLTDIIVTPYN